MGSHSEDSLDTTNKMYKLLIASALAVASALPIEDTAEVQEAKAVFNAAFAAAEAGEHAALAPVNADTQAAQIATAYIADTEDVAASTAAFDDAAAGGLAAKQAPAPVHEIPAPAPLVAAAPAVLPATVPYAAYPGVYGYGLNGLNVVGAYPGVYAHGLAYAGYPYAGLPVVKTA